jgi:serine/threonine protein kinase
MRIETCAACGKSFASRESEGASPVCPHCEAGALPTPDARAVRTDADFRARYELGVQVGKGASGTVYEAFALSGGDRVAVKFLRDTENAELSARFVREGRCLERVRHPNVVQVLEVGCCGSRPYLVTEFLAGGTLRDHLARVRVLSPGEAIELAVCCLEGLTACHEAGIVHRDIKPANILFGHDRTPKIADLGVARILGTDEKLTRTGDLVGTPQYMSPEQIRGEKAGAASDLYSMGLVLYEMLAGRAPFLAPTPFALMAMHAEAEPPLLVTLAPTVPPGIAAVVARALAKQAADRPECARAMADDLRRARGTGGRAAPRPGE